MSQSNSASSARAANAGRPASSERPARLARPDVEICANSLDSAIAADKAGADRIELCIELQVGGLTPSQELIERVLERISIPNHVLIRSRPGNFTYSADEVDTMLDEIRLCRDLGVAGVVIGGLTPEGHIDVPVIKEMISAAGPLHITFHRAFDLLADQMEALELLIELGVGRILTSGVNGTVVEGKDSLQTLVKLAGQRIRVMPGGGVRIENIRELHHHVGAMDYHASLLREGASSTLEEDVRAFLREFEPNPARNQKT